MPCYAYIIDDGCDVTSLGCVGLLCFRGPGHVTAYGGKSVGLGSSSDSDKIESNLP